MLLLTLLALLVSAQTVHPCDVTTVNAEVRPNVPFAIGVCHNGLDAEGLPTTIDSWRITMDGTTVYTGQMTRSATANTSGYYFYQSPKTLTAAKGNHTVIIYAVSTDGGEGAGSNPFVFTSKPGAPSKGVNVQVIR